jgi:hypothetical protein
MQIRLYIYLNLAFCLQLLYSCCDCIDTGKDTAEDTDTELEPKNGTCNWELATCIWRGFYIVARSCMRACSMGVLNQNPEN